MISHEFFNTYLLDAIVTVHSQELQEYIQTFDKDKFNIKQVLLVENKGMDIGGFFKAIQYLGKEITTYKAVLKIHTKTNDSWRNDLCNPLFINPKFIENVFTNYNYGSYGPQKYLFSLGHANENLIVHQLKQANIDTDDLYNEITKSTDTTLDPLFYINYHEDVKLLCQNFSKHEATNFAKKHWKEAHREHHRVPNESYITKYKRQDYKFFAGTMFWMNPKIIQFIQQNYNLDTIFNEFESGYIINDIERHTHKWEYIFGILVQKLGYQHLSEKPHILLLYPELDTEDTLCISGGQRTIQSRAEHLQSLGYQVSLVPCGTKNINLKNQRDAIYRYDEMKYVHLLDQHNVHTLTSIIIGTGYQTLPLLEQSQSNTKIWFIQDREELFQGVDKNTQKLVKNSYSKYTNIAFGDYLFRHSKSQNDSTYLNHFGVNTDIYYETKDTKQVDVCVFYMNYKKRMPKLLENVVMFLAKKGLRVSVFGHNFPTKHKNITALGTLTTEQLSALYQQSKIGICCSNSNISRVPYEMLACGVFVWEYESEFTQQFAPYRINEKQQSWERILSEERPSAFIKQQQQKLIKSRQMECAEFSQHVENIIS